MVSEGDIAGAASTARCDVSAHEVHRHDWVELHALALVIHTGWLGIWAYRSQRPGALHLATTHKAAKAPGLSVPIWAWLRQLLDPHILRVRSTELNWCSSIPATHFSPLFVGRSPADRWSCHSCG